jgi:hypothetical protein
MSNTEKKIRILERALSKIGNGSLAYDFFKKSSKVDTDLLLLKILGLSDLTPEKLSYEIVSLNKILIDLGYNNISPDSSWEPENNNALDSALSRAGITPGTKSISEIKSILSGSSKGEYTSSSGLKGKVINIPPGKVLFFRSGPSPKSLKIGELPPGKDFVFLNESEGYQGYEYIKISSDGRIGWVISNYVEYYNPDGSTQFSGKPVDKSIFRSSPRDMRKGDGSPSPSSGLIMPISGTKVRSGYGMRDDPMNRGHQRMHSGVDLSAKTGTPVLAPESGTITRIAPNNGNAGNMMVMSGTQGRVWTFMHLDSFNASNGDAISQGQVIAYSGATGGVTGPHLHLELRINGSKVDPMTVLSGASQEEIKPQSGGDRVESGKTDWLRSISSVSDSVSKKYGIPKSILLAQSSLESGFGKSDLGVFNFFGIKDFSGKGSAIRSTTEEYSPGVVTNEQSSFKAFESLEDSFESYGSLIKNNDRYSLATKRYYDQPSKFIIYVWGKGYATDSNYPQKISEVSKTVASKLSDPSLSFSFTSDEQSIISILATISGEQRASKTEEILGYRQNLS